MIKSAGRAIETAASRVRPLLALAWLQPLLEKYRDAGLTADAERVQVESRRRGSVADDSTSTRTYSIEIPQSVVDSYLTWLCSPEDPSRRFLRWAIQNVKDVKKAQESLLESLTTAPLGALISVRVVSDGQITAKAGSVENDLDARTAMHLRRLNEMTLTLFVVGWQSLVKHGGVDKPSIMMTLAQSPVFDEVGLSLIDAGVERFLSDDHLAATHILIPQVERALRNTLGLLNRPMNKPVRGEKGVMQEQNMNDALADPALKQVFPINLHQHLQVIFSSRLGFNLRNLIAHGILPVSQFSIATSLFALQGLLLLSTIRVEQDVA